MSVSWYCWWRTEEARWRSSLSETSRSIGAACRLLAEQRDFILEILLTARGDELQHRAAVFFVRHHEQTPPLAALVGFIGAQKRQQRLLTRGVQSDLQANVQGLRRKSHFCVFFWRAITFFLTKRTRHIYFSGNVFLFCPDAGAAKQPLSPGHGGYGAPAGESEEALPAFGTGLSSGELEAVKTVEEVREEIIRKASENEAFRSELLADPKAAIERELGVTIPYGFKIGVHEDNIMSIQPGLAAGRIERGGPERRRGRNPDDARLRQRLEQLEPELLMRYTERVP